MKVSETILKQIKILDKFALDAWGAKDFVYTNKGLQFRVGGLAKFKGLVHVKYNQATDLYDIDFLKMKKGLPTVVKTINNVYVFNLIKTIDSVVQ